MLGNYSALDKKELKICFLDYFAALEIPVIDYLAIGVQNTISKVSTSMMSNSDWQTTFSDLNLAEFDPIRKASFKTSANFFSFDGIDYQDKNGQEVMRQRKRHDIQNGIVFMRRELGHNFILTLGTGYKNFNAYKFLIQNNTAINTIFNELICMISPSTQPYQFKLINLQGDDAKLSAPHIQPLYQI